MAEDTRPEDSSWAVVTSGGGRRYVGMVEKNYNDGGHWVVRLKPAYELATMTRQVPIGPNQVGLQRDTRLFPIDRSLEDVRVRLLNPPEVILLNEDVSDSDRKRYLELVQLMQLEVIAARAKESGLEIPNMKLPPGFDPTKLRGGPSGSA